MSALPAANAEISVMLGGFVRRARVRAVSGTWLLYRVIGWDAEDQMVALDDEGTRWARGWDDEAAGALAAAHALKDAS